MLQRLHYLFFNMITDILNHHKVKQLSERILNTVHEVSSFLELLSLSEIIYFLNNTVHVSTLQV